MDAVGLQCSRANTTTYSDPVLGNHLVPDCTDYGCHHHKAQVSDLLGMDKSVDGLIASEASRSGDEGNDSETSDVLSLAVAIRESGRRRSATKPKRQPERHGGQRIGCIVQSVTQECDRPARHDDQRLNTGSD